MIENDAQLQQAYEALGDLYRALASYRAKILPANPRNYSVISQGPLEEIRKIQAEIDAYLGWRETETIVAASDSEAANRADALREVPPAYGHPSDSK